MYNNLIFRSLNNSFECNGCRIQASLLLFLSMQNGVVLLCPIKLCKSFKLLIINMLNSIYAFGDVINSEYLCIAKDPYYGRFEDRYSTHGYANQVRDAAGSRGVIRAW